MKPLKINNLIFIAVSTMLLAVTLAGCTPKDNGDYKSKPQPVHIENIVMGSGEYDKYSVELVLTDGEYFDSDHTVPGGGIYGENYSGSYVLKVFEGKELLSEFDLGERNIGSEFEIVFADYNEDEQIDFTIGDWAGSNYNEYTIFTIGESGELQKLGSIISSEFKYIEDYSAEFEHKNGVISTAYYDMDEGKTITVNYEWNKEENKFLQQN